MNGADVVVLIEDEVVGSQRDVTFGRTSETIDLSSKDSAFWKGDYGRRSSEVTLAALYVPSNLAYQALVVAWENGTQVTVRRQEQGAALEEAQAIVTKVDSTHPDQAESTVAVSLKINGEWAPVGS